MDRRALLLLALAGCAAPPASGVLAQTSTLGSSGDPNFDAWRAGFRDRAIAGGISPAVFDREMAGLTPDPTAQRLDGRQPEFSKPVSDYVRGVVSDVRITKGRQFRTSLPYLPEFERRYGLPREIMLAVWAMESDFGRIQGDMDVVRSLATLAADGRRRSWAEGELIATLKIIATGEQTRARLKGSWAGAMGQTQFLPSVYLSTAVDGDGDGRRDIWSSTPDALASTANYLAKAGWKPGESWSREVSVPAGFDFALIEQEREPLSAWSARGVRRADGLPWSAADQASRCSMIAPSGAGGPIFLIFPNHSAIMRYNNSTAYALGVGLLALRFGGENGTVRPWPTETPLSLADRTEAQKALTALGYDTGGVDGAVGPKTRAAVRAWQKSRGLPADGYLTPELIGRIRAEAGS
ncbi:MAG: lytic murein transglycosylase [Caulobacter sp.]